MSKVNSHLPVVSILISAKNAANTIGECLDSILNQDFQKEYLQILISDGLSDDDTVKIAQSCAAKANFYEFKIFSRHHKNLADGWNKVLPSATGKYVALVSPDMILSRNWLNGLMRHFTDSSVGGVSPHAVNYREPGFLTNYWSSYVYPKDVVEWPELDSAACILRGEVARKVGKFDISINRNEDADFTLSIRKQGYRLLHDPNIIVVHAHKRRIKDELYRYYICGFTTPYLYLKHRKIYGNTFWRRFFLHVSLPLSLLLFLFVSVYPINFLLFSLPWIANVLHLFHRMKKGIRYLPYLLFGLLCRFIMGIGYFFGFIFYLLRRAFYLRFPSKPVDVTVNSSC